MALLEQDLRYGLRVLRKSPGFTAAAVVLLALGIGANTAIFSVVDAVLLRPLPFADAERLVKVAHVPPAKSFPGMTMFSVSPANYLDWRRQGRSFETMAAYAPASFTLTGGDRPEPLSGSAVSADFFAVLRARPAAGRFFLPEEDQPGRGNVVVLSHSFWKSHFAASPQVIGRRLILDGQGYTVVGVLAPRFQLAGWNPTDVQLWTPLAWNAKLRALRGIHDYNVVARLKPGVTARQAQAEMDTISTRLARQYPADDAGWGAVVLPLHQYLVGNVRPALLVLLGAVILVLLIACANVANLVLARTLGRRKEIAIRAALGAGRGRVLRQILAESLLVALAGGALGLVIARFGVRLIVAFLADLPRATEIGLDGRVLAFTLAVSLLTGVAAGLAPALPMTRPDLSAALKSGLGRTDASSGGGGRTRGMLVVAEVALSLLLLVGAGLMIRSLAALRAVAPGLDPRHVLTMTVGISATKYPRRDQQQAFFDRLLQRVRSLPGVESAGVVDSLPLSGGGGSMQPIAIAGRPAAVVAEQPEVAVRRISPGYLRALRIPLLRGRDLAATDAANQPAVVLVSASMARRFWPGEDPVGKRLTLSFVPQTSRLVVGVVGDVKQRGLDEREPVATLYRPLAQEPTSWLSLVVRTVPPPLGSVGAIESAIREIDPDQPAQDVLTMEDVLGRSLAQRRFNMLLLAAFAGLALILAAAGIYSVLAYSVRRRVREIGIRMALGAQLRDVLRLILVEGMKPALAGMALGLAAAVAFDRVVASLLYGVSATDPTTFAAVSALLGGVALAACVIPAHRATRVQPMAPLREE